MKQCIDLYMICAASLALLVDFYQLNLELYETRVSGPALSIYQDGLAPLHPAAYTCAGYARSDLNQAKLFII